MSSRNFRKLCGNSLPPPDSDDSDDYFPLGERQPKKSIYEGLEVSSDSSAQKVSEVEEDENNQVPATSVAQGARKKKLQKKKGKGKGMKNMPARKKSSASISSGEVAVSSSEQGGPARSTSFSQAGAEELDEIDKSIMEVNALLGAPPPAPDEPKASPTSELRKAILGLNAKHLNVSVELRRLFGPENADEIRARNKSQPHRTRLLKRVVVGPTNDTAIYDAKKMGLSMSVEKRPGNILHCVYNHDRDYQKMHVAFLDRYARNFMRQGTALLSMDDARKHMHVEPLLEIADTFFRLDEYGLANEIVENVMVYLQYVAHPSFNLADTNVRLLYTFVENRPFHVVMLKYMYLLTNKACHRTALEIAKMLLSIDPGDPLAVLFIIDTLALRAREHQWLIDAIDYYNAQRQAKLMFNIQYSYALAHFHVATKKKEDLSGADKQLQIAMMSYPSVVLKIMEFANMSESRIQTHTLFTNDTISHPNEGLSELIMIYAKLTWPRWKEPKVMEWFIKNAIEVTENFNNNNDVRNRVKELAVLRQHIFQVWPEQILRHISVIRSMSNLLLETSLSPSNRPTSGWDPLFHHGVNRYNYRTPTETPRDSSQGQAFLDRFFRFFTSIVPDTELEPPVDN